MEKVKRFIIKNMYAVLLFRYPSESEIDGKLNRAGTNELNDFIEKNSSVIMVSEEKTKKMNQDPFRFFNNISKSDLIRLNELLVIEDVGLSSDVVSFLKTEVEGLLYGFSLGENSIAYKDLCKSKFNNISLLSNARLIQIGSKSKDELIAKKRSLFQNIDNSISSKDLFNKEQELLGRNIAGLELRNHRSAMLTSSNVLSDALGSYILNNFERYTSEELVGIFRTALTITCHSKPQINFLSSYLEEILSAENTLPSLSYKYDLPIFCVGGFHYSGSSAIHDFLRGHSGASEIKDGDTGVEIPLTGAYYELIKNGSEPSSILRFYLYQLLNIFTPENHHNINLKSSGFSFYERSRIGKSKINLDCYIERIGELLRGVNSNNVDIQRKSLSSFLNGFATSDFVKPGFLILNQSPVALNIQAINALPNQTKYVAVYRDPRDQFVDQVNHGSIKNKLYQNVEGFIKNYQNERTKYINIKNKNCSEYKIFETYFEDFVTSEEERKKVCGLLEIDYEICGKYFNSEVSKRNIFKYKSWSNQDEIKLIENELSDYLWKI